MCTDMRTLPVSKGMGTDLSTGTYGCFCVHVRVYWPVHRHACASADGQAAPSSPRRCHPVCSSSTCRQQHLLVHSLKIESRQAGVGSAVELGPARPAARPSKRRRCAQTITTYWHRRRHVQCTGIGMPVLKMTALQRGGHFEYRHANTCPMDMPLAMPICS